VKKEAKEAKSNFLTGSAAPARRALASAGYSRLEQLTKVTEAETGRLHGMGPKALETLRRALAVKGQSFARADRA
jgi:hypothetical protein